MFFWATNVYIVPLGILKSIPCQSCMRNTHMKWWVTEIGMGSWSLRAWALKNWQDMWPLGRIERVEFICWTFIECPVSATYCDRLSPSPLPWKIRLGLKRTQSTDTRRRPIHLGSTYLSGQQGIRKEGNGVNPSCREKILVESKLSQSRTAVWLIEQLHAIFVFLYFWPLNLFLEWTINTFICWKMKKNWKVYCKSLSHFCPSLSPYPVPLLVRFKCWKQKPLWVL